MTARDRIPRIRALVCSRGEWFARGWNERTLSEAIGSGEMVRLSRSSCILREEWEALWPEQRLLARVLATAPLQRGSGYYCRESAAVLHGIPLYRFAGRRAQILIPNARSTHHSQYLERYLGLTLPEELGWIQDVPCTSLDRTLLDIARHSPLGLGIAALDHAARHLFPTPRGSPPPPECLAWLDSLRTRLAGDASTRGKAKGDRLIALADPGAESPLESVARLRLIELGYEVRTQVAVPSPGGGLYFADLELVGLDVLVEVDGRAKYTDEELRGDRSIQEVILREKRREDWTRNRVGKRILRLMAPDVTTSAALQTVLREQRIPFPPLAGRRRHA